MQSDNSISRRPLLEWVLDRFPDTPAPRNGFGPGDRIADQVMVSGTGLAGPGNTSNFWVRRTERIFNCAWRIHPKLTVLYLDASLSVVDKSPGLLSVPQGGAARSALQILREFLQGRIQTRPRITLPPAYRQLRPMPVHRIDQYTSGTLCIALNPKARANLIEQFTRHQPTRQYIAYVDGRPRPARGTWRHWLKLSADDRLQEVVTEREAKSNRTGAAVAITHYETIDEFAVVARGRTHAVTKLRLRLDTGCKHQIRVQAAAAGVPVIGDRTYHPRYRHDSQSPGSAPFLSRQALHAELSR